MIQEEQREYEMFITKLADKSLEVKEDFDKLCSSEEIDLMILPGVCFDKNLNRIGFGKGYYDRYLENSNSIYKIGICFKEQITKDILPHDTYDIRLDEIICD